MYSQVFFLYAILYVHNTSACGHLAPRFLILLSAQRVPCGHDGMYAFFFMFAKT